MLKDTWVDKKDGVDINSAEDINQVAHAVIDLEKEAENKDETGIHIGPEAPTNGEQIWIDTDEENAEAGGTSIDVTAEVGQTIIVKEVDANGKPTKWEAVEYQERTHGKDFGELLPNTTASYSEEDGLFAVECGFEFVVGNSYCINWNGVSYTCVATALDGAVVGNAELLSGTGDTGEPFFACVMDGVLMAIPFDGSTELVIGVSGEIIKKIDKKYLPEDVGYCDPKYGQPVFNFETWAWREAGVSNLTGITKPYDGNPEDAWENTEFTQADFEKMAVIFQNHLVFLDSVDQVLCGMINGDQLEIYFQKVGYTTTAVYVNNFALKFKWSDAEGCVQRSCVITAQGQS